MCKTDGFKVVSCALLEQIELARAVLENEPDFDFVRRHMIYHSLNNEANRHSVDMEINGSKPRKSKAKARALDNLRSAREFFVKNYDNELSNTLIKQTAYLINPISDTIKYREDSMTRSSDGSVYPRDVPNKMEKFMEENRALSNPVGKAFHSHFHISRIHPFNDGNGRLARLVQDGILDVSGYPPVSLEPSERGEYIDLLRGASESYRFHKKIKPEQSRFYNYLATKLIDSLRKSKKRINKS